MNIYISILFLCMNCYNLTESNTEDYTESNKEDYVECVTYSDRYFVYGWSISDHSYKYCVKKDGLSVINLIIECTDNNKINIYNKISERLEEKHSKECNVNKCHKSCSAKNRILLEAYYKKKIYSTPSLLSDLFAKKKKSKVKKEI